MTFKEIKNCEIVFGNKTKEMFPARYQIWIRNIDTNKLNIINIGTPSTIQQMKELMCGVRTRCYLAYRMTDIDMYKVEDKFVISNSPFETLYNDYYLTEEQFLSIIQDLETDET